MGGDSQEQPPGTGDGAGDTGTGHGGANVEDRLSKVYQGSLTLNWRYTLVGLGVLVVWWLLFRPISTFFALLGMLALGSGLGPIRTALTSRRWPTTEAVVLESRVFTLDELSDRFPGLTTTGSTSGGYVPFVRYEYSVNGVTYVNVRVSPFDGTFRRRRRAERLTDSYEQNTHVTVPYDPADPSRSFLRTWTLSPRLLVFIIGTVVCSVPAIWLAAGIPIPVSVNPVVVSFAALAGFVILLALYQTLQAVRTHRWPTTAGVVRGQDVRVSHGGEGSSTSYYPKLRYEYEVDGSTYVSSDRGPSFSSRSDAQEWLEEYPDGAEVTVHYSSRRPDRSVLEPGGVLRAVLLLVFVGVGLTILLGLTGNLPQPVEQFLRESLEQLLGRLRG